MRGRRGGLGGGAVASEVRDYECVVGGEEGCDFVPYYVCLGEAVEKEKGWACCWGTDSGDGDGGEKGDAEGKEFGGIEHCECIRGVSGIGMFR